VKKLMLFSTELLSFVALGFLLGHFLDKQFFLEGWGVLGGLFLAYSLWIFNFYKSSRKKNKS